MDRYSHPGVDRIFPCFYLLQDSCIHVKKSLYIYTYNSTSIYSFIDSIYFVIVHPIYNPDLQYQHMPRTLRTLRTLCHIPVAAINSLVMAGAVLTNVAVSRSFSWNARWGVVSKNVTTYGEYGMVIYISTCSQRKKHVI